MSERARSVEELVVNQSNSTVELSRREVNEIRELVNGFVEQEMDEDQENEMVADDEKTKEKLIDMLSDEISRLKQQKAKLRIESIRANNEVQNLKKELAQSLKDYNFLVTVKENAVKEASEFKTKLESSELELAAARRREALAVKDSNAAASKSQKEIDRLRDQSETTKSQLVKLKDFIKEQDKQCEALAFLENDSDSWKQLLEQKTLELAKIRREFAEMEAANKDNDRMRREFATYRDRAIVLDRQLKCRQEEYQSELADMKEQLIELRERQTAQSNNEISTLRSQICELKAEVKSGKDLLNQKDHENENLMSELRSLRRDKAEAQEKATNVSTRVDEILFTLETKENEFARQNSEKAELENELGRVYDQLSDLEEECRTMRLNLERKDEEVVYWKRMYEHRNQDDESDISTKSEVSVPATKKVRVEVHSEVPEIPKYGVMRHEIAHRFKTAWMALERDKNAVCCARCSEALPTVSTAMKCRDCHIYVHISCSRRIGKTCSLPVELATLYMEAVNEQGSSMACDQRL